MLFLLTRLNMRILVILFNVYCNLLLVFTARGDYESLDPSWMDPDKYYQSKEATQQ